MTVITPVTGEGELILPPAALKALGGAGPVTVEQITGGVAVRPEGALRLDADPADFTVPAVVAADGKFTVPPEIYDFMRIWMRWRREGGLSVTVTDDGAVIIMPEHIQGPESLRKHYAGLELNEDEEMDFSVQSVKEVRAESWLEEQAARRARADTARGEADRARARTRAGARQPLRGTG